MWECTYNLEALFPTDAVGDVPDLPAVDMAKFKEEREDLYPQTHMISVLCAIAGTDQHDQTLLLVEAVGQVMRRLLRTPLDRKGR